MFGIFLLKIKILLFEFLEHLPYVHKKKMMTKTLWQYL